MCGIILYMGVLLNICMNNCQVGNLQGMYLNIFLSYWFIHYEIADFCYTTQLYDCFHAPDN